MFLFPSLKKRIDFSFISQVRNQVTYYRDKRSLLKELEMHVPAKPGRLYVVLSALFFMLKLVFDQRGSW